MSRESLGNEACLADEMARPVPLVGAILGGRGSDQAGERQGRDGQFEWKAAVSHDGSSPLSVGKAACGVVRADAGAQAGPRAAWPVAVRGSRWESVPAISIWQ